MLNSMATLESKSATALKSTPITCIQPGGFGPCVQLELAWGRLRRAGLRRFRPAYVARMAARRHGECPGCPHDVIDSRDLKFFRNVCGYRFGPDDDPFKPPARFWLTRAGLAELVCFGSLFFGLAILFGIAGACLHPVLWILTAVAGVLGVFVVRFFRDPPRNIPVDAAALLSPADGLVTFLGVVDEPDFPGGKAYRISIFLSVFDVHVNRVPRTGRVARVSYYPGEFLDARHAGCAVRNEQLWVDLEEPGSRRLLRLKQISGAIARRIVCWLRSGEEVRAGDHFGMIKFGSRTDILLPADETLDLQVRVGDHVRGGSTVLLRFRDEPANRVS